MLQHASEPAMACWIQGCKWEIQVLLQGRHNCRLHSMWQPCSGRTGLQAQPAVMLTLSGCEPGHHCRTDDSTAGSECFV